jgi:hypothetical protein
MTGSEKLRFVDHRNEMARQMAKWKVREALAAPPEPALKFDERLAQCVWFDSLFVHDGLKTDSGKTLEILQPGRWNSEGGPDFRDAKLRIGGVDRSGDVEIHLESAGWRQHRHHLNPEYDNVILHAYLRPDDSVRECLDSKGRPVEGFCMEPSLFPDLESIRQTVHVEDYPFQSPSSHGLCQPLMCSLDESFVGGMLTAAGHERLEVKARRLDEQAYGGSLDQAFYQALMTHMGHGAGKSLFFLLSKRAPLSEMIDYVGDVARTDAVLFFQSVLLHVARLAPEGDELADLDPESRDHAERIGRLWRNFAPYFSDRLIARARQWNSGVRPVNFAQRRLAGMAWLLEACFLGEGFAPHFSRVFRGFDPGDSERKRLAWIRRNLADFFVVDKPGDFWAWRYNFTARRAAQPMKLVGESRAASLALNALLPLMLLHSRRERDLELEDRVWAVFEALPALESNAIVRHMSARLFAEDPRGRHLLKKEVRQQGLFHIFAECCRQNEKGCEDCVYLSAPEA